MELQEKLEYKNYEKSKCTFNLLGKSGNEIMEIRGNSIKI